MSLVPVTRSFDRKTSITSPSFVTICNRMPAGSVPKTCVTFEIVFMEIRLSDSLLINRRSSFLIYPISRNAWQVLDLIKAPNRCATNHFASTRCPRPSLRRRGARMTLAAARRMEPGGLLLGPADNDVQDARARGEHLKQFALTVENGLLNFFHKFCLDFYSILCGSDT